MLFLGMLKSRDFKSAIGASSIKVDHNRKSKETKFLREFGFKIGYGKDKFIFLVGLYQPNHTLTSKGFGVLNFNDMDRDLDEGRFIKRDLVRQVRVTSGLNEGYLLYSYEPDYKSYGEMVAFLSHIISKTASK